MKRSEMEQRIYEVLLKHIPQEASMNLAEDILTTIEDYGMNPPSTSTVSCSDPDIFLKIDSPDAGFTIPSYFVAGWDDE